MKKIRIVSGGQGFNTKVMCGDDELQGVKHIMILPIRPGSNVQALVTFKDVELDVTAEQIREEDTK